MSENKAASEYKALGRGGRRGRGSRGRGVEWAPETRSAAFQTPTEKSRLVRTSYESSKSPWQTAFQPFPSSQIRELGEALVGPSSSTNFSPSRNDKSRRRSDTNSKSFSWDVNVHRQSCQVSRPASDSSILSSASQRLSVIESVPLPDSSQSFDQRSPASSRQVSSMTSILSTSLESEIGSLSHSPMSTPGGSTEEPSPSILSSPSWRLAIERPIQSDTSLPSLQLPDTPENTPRVSPEDTPKPSVSVSSCLAISSPVSSFHSRLPIQRPLMFDSSLPRSPRPSVHNPRGLVQGPPPRYASPVSIVGPSLLSVRGSPWVSQQGSAPPLSSPLVTVQGPAPPSGPGSPWVSVERSAPPSDTRQGAEQGSVPPWAVPTFKPKSRENFTQTMTDLEKPNTTGHMFDVVVIGGGISGQFGSLTAA